MNPSASRVRAVAVVGFMAFASSAEAQQIVTVTVPSGVTFTVNDVASSTTGSPNPMTVSYSNALLFLPGQKLRISVKADSSTFSGPGTTHIAATAVSWTASTASGSAFNGSLSSLAYTQVYTKSNPSSGSVALQWTLGPIVAAGLRAGNHTLSVRWRFEAF